MDLTQRFNSWSWIDFGLLLEAHFSSWYWSLQIQGTKASYNEDSFKIMVIRTGSYVRLTEVGWVLIEVTYVWFLDSSSIDCNGEKRYFKGFGYNSSFFNIFAFRNHHKWQNAFLWHVQNFALGWLEKNSNKLYKVNLQTFLSYMK